MKKFAAGIPNCLLPPEDSASKNVEGIDTRLWKVKNSSFAAVGIGDTTGLHDQCTRGEGCLYDVCRRHSLLLRQGVQERDQSSCGSDCFQIHQASTHRNSNGLRTPCNLQLFQDVRHVHLDSGLADV